MCEIAVCNPESCNLSIMHQIAAKFHAEQGDGLGVLAVKHNSDGFEYETYKSTTPHWQTLHEFMSRHLNDTWRFVIHGRFGTCGGVNRAAAHPIHVDCDKCEFDHVVHNGSVRNHRSIRAGLIGAEHDFNTKVDSEILAHKVSELPESVADHGQSTYSFSGNLNYLLFADDGILIRVSKKYHLTDDVSMTCSRRSFENPDELGFERSKNEWMLITPAEGQPDVETKEYTYSRSRSKNTRSGTVTRRTTQETYSSWPNGGGASADDHETDKYAIAYENLLPNAGRLVAVKVAPGIVKLIDTEEDKSEFIYRDADPRMYYWYTDETPDHDIEQLEIWAEQNPIKPGQTSLSDFAEDSEANEIQKEIASAAGEAVMDATDGDMDMREAAEIANEVYDILEQDTNLVEGAVK